MESEIIKVGRTSKKNVPLMLTLARKCEAVGDIKFAYIYYFIAARSSNEIKLKIQKVITDLLCELGIMLEQSNRAQDAIECYGQVLELYPQNARLLNNLGAHFLRLGQPLEAITCLKTALARDPFFLPAERNLQNAYSMIVNEWHFSMLNDKYRNHAFDQAIRKAILAGYDTVLDIGTGTGLLSLYAYSAGAKKVYTCECQFSMCKIAYDVLKRNNATDIKLIPKMSLDLTIPDNLHDRVKLVITETFDAALFGEHVLPTLIHAHSNLLHEKGIIVPMKASIYMAAVECDYIQLKSFARFDGLNYSSSLNFEGLSVLSNEEFYDTENLKNVKLNYVTECKEILKVNFNNLNELRSLHENGVKSIVTTKCLYDNTINALVVWFKLHLDEEIEIDSSQGKSCWQFAVFPVVSYDVCQGETITLVTEMCSGILKCSYVTDKIKMPIMHDALYKLPVEVITFLNDNHYVSILESIAKSKKENNIQNVLDTCPFPIYGLTLLKENAYCKMLYYKTDDLLLMDFIKKIAIKSDIPVQSIRFISDFRYIESTLDDIYVQNFDIKGESKDWGKKNCYEFFSNFLSPTGTLFPKKFYLMGQLIYSEDLSNMTCVNNDNVQRFVSSESTTNSGTQLEDKVTITFQQNTQFENTSSPVEQSHYSIAESINKFSVNQVFDLNTSVYLFETISDEKIIAEMGGSKPEEYTINFGKLEIPNSKLIPNALLCWYKIMITDDCELSTKRKESFINQTAIFLKDELESIISQGKEVQLKIYKVGDFIKISAGI